MKEKGIRKKEADMEKLLRYRDAAELLSASERSIRRWVVEKDIKTVRIGRCIRIPESEMKKFIDSECNVQNQVNKFTMKGG